MGTRVAVVKILDEGLDEMAARSYQGLPLRLGVTLGAAGLVSLMLPLRLCAAWLMLIYLSEGVAALVTRPQYLGRKVGTGIRVTHLAALTVACLFWMGLGALLWTTGTPVGAASAVVLWLSVIFFAQNNAYQSTVGFVVGGAIPGLAMLAFVALGPNPLHLPLIPIGGLLLLALGFTCDGVMRTLAVRRKFEDAQRKLADSEAQYRLLADNISDIICLNTLDGKRLYMSPSVRHALGYAVEELFDDNYGAMYPDDAPIVSEALARLVKVGGEMTLQYRMMHKLGHAVWVETNFAVIAGDGESSPPMLVSVCRNIDSRKALETELVEARQRAEEAAAAKSDFLANMTHELRTPLNAIIGFSGILQSSPRLDGQDARHANLINTASATLLELVNSVLDFSRLEAGAVELEEEAFDPAEPARAMAALLAEQASAKGLDLVVRVEGEVTPLIGDPARIRQVLLNFLSNALKFTAAGTVTVTVRQTSLDGDLGRLRVEVTDSGIGVAQAKIDQLFDRFTQADATVSRRYGGTGLGLAICKRLIDLMGGTIGCDSTPKQGSTFWFELTLPRAGSLAELADEPVETTPDAPLRLLVVEDVAVNRELISALLAPFDITIDMAENGAQAVQAMVFNSYDVVLMDVQMPVMDGLTATQSIRVLEGAGPGTPIIAMTANVLPEQVRKCLEAGMDDHIGKPISPASLLGALSKWSAGREAVAEAERMSA